ncbi:MAG: hypothetical protein ACRCY3_11690 [Sphingorhabdus sp.]
MTLAMKRLKNIGWLALVFMVAVLLYPLSLNVATLHSDLSRIDREILDTKQEINFLQAEIRTRASVAQLEEWNQLLYGYEPPRAEQFIDGERGLASLGGAAEGVKPVLVAVDAPAGEVGGAGAVASVDMEDSNDETVIVKKAKPENEVPRVAIVEKLKPKTEAKSKPKAEEPKKAKAETRTERLARMDEKLLSDNLMQEIQKKSEKERKKK